jgi:parallel beta-helix repeat protein
MPWRARRCSILVVFLMASPGFARDVPVATTAELQAALGAAQAGDVILLADGTYAFTGSSWGAGCSAAGTAAAPIVVRAATPLGAKIEFDVVEGFNVSGPYWRFEDLDIRGTCADDSKCEHAFHVVGQAAYFEMRQSRIVDFNAQLKVNADGAHNLPDHGLVEGNELYDTRPRTTSNPVTKLNIDNASYWVVRANLIYDFAKGGGDGVSYGAFHKGGSQSPVFERNLVLCTFNQPAADTRIGLSFGGGGMGAGMCPPWDGSDCNPETVGGIMRNNIIVNCSDVGIYLNEAQDTKILHNTLIETNGVDFRFATSTGEAHGNVLGSVIRVRNGGSFAGSDNLMNVPLADFTAWYVDPLRGDLRLKGDLSAVINQGGVTPDVTDDYCARPRSDRMFDWGALEHSLGDCATTRPPVGPSGVTDAGVDGPPSPVDAATDAPAAGDGGAPADAARADANAGSGSDGGCGCHGASPAAPALGALLALGACGWLRRRAARRPS